MTKKRKLKLLKYLPKTAEKKPVKQRSVQKGRKLDYMRVILLVLFVTITVGPLFSACVRGFSGHVNVVIDVAYGGDSYGYEGLLRENDVCEKVAGYLVEMLQNDDHFTVSRTHEADEAMVMSDRIAVIEKDKADIVLSLHADGNPNSSCSGMIVYADPPGSKTHEESLRLANTIAGAFRNGSWEPVVNYMYYEPSAHTDAEFIIKRVPESDLNNYKLKSWPMMEQCSAPVVISDAFYVTNKNDVARWGNEEAYKEAAELYYKALKLTYGFGE